MSTAAELRGQLERGLAVLDLPLSERAVSQLLDFQALLERWNGTYNLTAVRDPQEMIARHLLDSLAILPYVRGDSLVDLGTGPGLPGVVLAIAAPQRQVLLVDSNGKKVRFLREVIRSLGLSHVRVEQARVEAIEGEFDCVTARAFASLADMLAWGGALLAPGGEWLAMKGRVPHEELAALPAGFVLRRSVPLQVPGIEGERHLLILGREGAPGAGAGPGC